MIYQYPWVWYTLQVTIPNIVVFEMPTSARDPGLLCDPETPLVIGKKWFLHYEIPAGDGFNKKT